MRRRLFDGLEQRVERLRRQPVHFVDDEDLVAIAHRRHPEAGDDDVADLVDLRVRGGVDLEDVHVASFGNLEAGVARSAGIGRRTGVAVQGARQNSRRRRLADAARPGKHERLRDAARRDGVAQRLRDTALADDVIESLRAPLASENLVSGHRRKKKVAG